VLSARVLQKVAKRVQQCATNGHEHLQKRVGRGRLAVLCRFYIYIDTHIYRVTTLWCANKCRAEKNLRLQTLGPKGSVGRSRLRLEDGSVDG
jgi:hypothetical protein